MTLAWLGADGVRHTTRPNTDGEMVFVIVPVDAATGAKMKLVDVFGVSAAVRQQLLKEFG
jgi:hypothetical protein